MMGLDMKISAGKVRGILYDHWKVLLPSLLPIISVLLLSVWGYFRDLMLTPVPFWLLFFTLVFISFTLIWIVVLQKKISKLRKSKEEVFEAILIDNLIYKDGKGQPYCPVCYEKDSILRRMKVFDQGDYNYYECFICEYNTTVNNEVSVEDIPF